MRKHPDCVAMECGRTDCQHDDTGIPCYVKNPRGRYAPVGPKPLREILISVMELCETRADASRFVDDHLLPALEAHFARATPESAEDYG